MNTVYHTFSEAGKCALRPEQPIEEVWDSIQVACGKTGTVDDLEKAIKILRTKYDSPDSLRSTLQNGKLILPAAIERRVLFHFVSKWQEYEDNLARVSEDRKNAGNDLSQIMTMHGRGRGSSAMTPDQVEHYRHRKKQRRSSNPH